MKSAMKNLVIGMLSLMPAILYAHPGHGHENPLSPGHYLGNPEHSIPILLTGAVVTIVLIWQLKRAVQKK